jgi:hypothetical protein
MLMMSYVAEVQVCSLRRLATNAYWNNFRCSSWNEHASSCSYLWKNDQHFNYTGM